MKKLLTLIAFVSFMGIFSSCDEEAITPQDNLEVTGTGDDKGQGTADDDKGQWD